MDAFRKVIFLVPLLVLGLFFVTPVVEAQGTYTVDVSCSLETGPFVPNTCIKEGEEIQNNCNPGYMPGEQTNINCPVASACSDISESFDCVPEGDSIPSEAYIDDDPYNNYPYGVWKMDVYANYGTDAGTGDIADNSERSRIGIDFRTRLGKNLDPLGLMPSDFPAYRYDSNDGFDIGIQSQNVAILPIDDPAGTVTVDNDVAFFDCDAEDGSFTNWQQGDCWADHDRDDPTMDGVAGDIQRVIGGTETVQMNFPVVNGMQWLDFRIAYHERGGNDIMEVDWDDSNTPHTTETFSDYVHAVNYGGKLDALAINEDSTEISCGDGIDNDANWEGDGWAEGFNASAYADKDVTFLGDLTNYGAGTNRLSFPDFGETGVDCFDASCDGSPGPLQDGTSGMCNYGVETNCSDGYDNDWDGLVDHEDLEDCGPPSTCVGTTTCSALGAQGLCNEGPCETELEYRDVKSDRISSDDLNPGQNIQFNNEDDLETIGIDTSMYSSEDLEFAGTDLPPGASCTDAVGSDGIRWPKLSDCGGSVSVTFNVVDPLERCVPQGQESFDCPDVQEEICNPISGCEYSNSPSYCEVDETVESHLVNDLLYDSDSVPSDTSAELSARCAGATCSGMNTAGIKTPRINTGDDVSGADPNENNTYVCTLRANELSMGSPTSFGDYQYNAKGGSTGDWYFAEGETYTLDEEGEWMTCDEWTKQGDGRTCLNAVSPVDNKEYKRPVHCGAGERPESLAQFQDNVEEYGIQPYLHAQGTEKSALMNGDVQWSGDTTETIENVNTSFSGEHELIVKIREDASDTNWEDITISAQIDNSNVAFPLEDSTNINYEGPHRFTFYVNENMESISFVTPEEFESIDVEIVRLSQIGYEHECTPGGKIISVEDRTGSSGGNLCDNIYGGFVAGADDCCGANLKQGDTDSGTQAFDSGDSGSSGACFRGNEITPPKVDDQLNLALDHVLFDGAEQQFRLCNKTFEELDGNDQDKVNLQSQGSDETINSERYICGNQNWVQYNGQRDLPQLTGLATELVNEGDEYRLLCGPMGKVLPSVDSQIPACVVSLRENIENTAIVMKGDNVNSLRTALGEAENRFNLGEFETCRENAPEDDNITFVLCDEVSPNVEGEPWVELYTNFNQTISIILPETQGDQTFRVPDEFEVTSTGFDMILERLDRVVNNFFSSPTDLIFPEQGGLDMLYVQSQSGIGETRSYTYKEGSDKLGMEYIVGEPQDPLLQQLQRRHNLAFSHRDNKDNQRNVYFNETQDRITSEITDQRDDQDLFYKQWRTFVGIQ